MFPRFQSPLRTFCVAMLPGILTPLPVFAQPQLHPTPFSIGVSPSALLAERPISSLPMWVESISVLHPPKDPNHVRRTVVRLRLRKLSALIHTVELRITLAAGPSGQATLTAWNETGMQISQSAPFGSAEAALTEVVRIPIEGVDYIDLSLPLDGSRLTGLFTTAMKKSPVLHAIDFPPPPVQESFAPAPSVSPDPEADRLLLGRIAATLEAGPLVVGEETPTLIDFEISQKPSAALLTFEVRSVLAGEPPLALINGVELHQLSINFPDLADPAWRTRKRIGIEEPALQYSGWIRMQGLLPPSALLPGQNQISLQQSRFGGTVEIRNVELQIRNLR